MAPLLNIIEQEQDPTAGMNLPRNDDMNDQQNGTNHPPPPAWMVEHNNAQTDPIDVTPIQNHSHSKHYNSSGLLLQDRLCVLNTLQYRESAIIQVQKGIMWDRPAELLHHHRVNKTDSWTAFFKYPIFNWFPNEMIPGDWKPRCGWVLFQA